MIYTGPGIGIVVTGLVASAAARHGAAAGWIGFGALSAVLTAAVWGAFAPDPGERTSRPSATGQSAARERASGNAPPPTPPQAASAAASHPPGHRAAAAWLVLLYGMPGFGYIVTATFLPVIARDALPGSAWPDLFWPMLGAALIPGSLIAARLPSHWDNRLLLAGCYVLQAAGIALGNVLPNAAGFSFGSVLVGLPLTAITLFAMREARRLRGDHAAGLMGYATAAYGVGQIVGPLVAGPIAARTGSFSLALWLAAAVLAAGAIGLVAVALGSRGGAANAAQSR